MPDNDEAAKQAAAASGKSGAKEGDSLTPEALRKAQDAAEQYRKEAEAAKEKHEAVTAELETKKAELDELNNKFNLTEAEKRRKIRLESGIEDDEVLAAQLEAEAAQGVKWAKAVDASIKKVNKEIRSELEKTVKTLSQQARDREIDYRDDWIEEIVEKRGIKDETVKSFTKRLGDIADESLDGRPMLQAKKAYKALLEREKFDKEKSDFEAEKRKNGNFRDGGTDHKGGEGGKVDFTKDWQKAKTQEEKLASLADI